MGCYTLYGDESNDMERGDQLHPGLFMHTLGFSDNYVALCNLQNTFTYVTLGCL